MTVSIPSPSGLLQNTVIADHRAISGVSIPSPSGLLQNYRPLSTMRRPQSVSIPSPSGLLQNEGIVLITSTIVSIPSPSGLLQNARRALLVLRQVVSIPSPSGLLQNAPPPLPLSLPPFQSLLLQVSFKTWEKTSKRRRRSFNPFSFRSPSKRSCSVSWSTTRVSIPSPSGLLQNARLSHNRCPRMSFNPFSFRSPSKPDGGRNENKKSVSIPSPSGLLQNTPNP